jgi:hypothetical protein
MNRFKISFILLPLITATWSNSIESQDLHTTDVTQDLTTDPRVAKLVVDDVENFIRVQGLLASTSDTLETLQREYLDKGTPGLKMFIEKYDLTAERLLKAMRKYPDKYSSLHDLPDGIRAMEGEVHQAFTRLKEVIPQTMFPPTYFVVAGHRGIGSGSTEGPLVSVEKWSVPIEDETTMLIHEMVHIQQVMAVGYERYKALFGPEKSLLGLCIREGTAEFFAHLVTGSMTQDEAIEFTKKHEERLWASFVEEMDGSETGDWMWSKPKDAEQPRHVGYVMGAFIVQAYYDNAEDKARAVRDILGVTDYAAFLERSGYAARFKSQ